jgi:hypothetical protein
LNTWLVRRFLPWTRPRPTVRWTRGCNDAQKSGSVWEWGRDPKQADRIRASRFFVSFSVPKTTYSGVEWGRPSGLRGSPWTRSPVRKSTSFNPGEPTGASAPVQGDRPTKSVFGKLSNIGTASWARVNNLPHALKLTHYFRERVSKESCRIIHGTMRVLPWIGALLAADRPLCLIQRARKSSASTTCPPKQCWELCSPDSADCRC